MIIAKDVLKARDNLHCSLMHQNKRSFIPYYWLSTPFYAGYIFLRELNYTIDL